MTDSLSSIVDVTISTSGVSLSRRGFGTVLIASPHTQWSDRTRSYANLAAVLEDFPSDTIVYAAATALTRQSPTVNTFKIGRLQSDSQNITVSTTTAGHVYGAKINDTVSAITEGAAAYAITGVVTGTKTFTIAGDHDDEYLAGEKFSVSGSTGNDGLYTVVSATYGVATEIIVSETIADATVDGSLGLTVAAALSAEINSDSSATVTATHPSANVVNVANAGTAFYSLLIGTGDGAAFAESHSKMTIDWFDEAGGGAGTTYEDWSDGLSTIVAADDNWYGFAICTRDQDYQEDVAEWAQSATLKFFLTSESLAASRDTTAAADTTSLPAVLSAASYGRGADIWHSESDGTSDDEWPEITWMASTLSVNLDTSEHPTWCYKTLTGVTADSFSSTQRTNLEGKNANYYETVGSASVTRYGTCFDGEWIDVTVGIDWLQTRMEEAVAAVLIGASQRGGKVPYTQNGINAVAGAIEGVLKSAMNVGFLAFDSALDDTKGYVLTVPSIGDISSATRDTRVLSGLSFRATAAGAIHKVEITGVVA